MLPYTGSPSEKYKITITFDATQIGQKGELVLIIHCIFGQDVGHCFHIVYNLYSLGKMKRKMSDGYYHCYFLQKTIKIPDENVRFFFSANCDIFNRMPKCLTLGDTNIFT